MLYTMLCDTRQKLHSSEYVDMMDLRGMRPFHCYQKMGFIRKSSKEQRNRLSNEIKVANILTKPHL